MLGNLFLPVNEYVYFYYVLRLCKYSVMQSDGTVLAEMSSLDEDSVYDQAYDKQIFWKLCYEDFKFLELLRKIYIKRNIA